MIKNVFIHSITKCCDSNYTRVFYYPCIISNKSYFGIPYGLKSFKININFENLKDVIDFYEPYELYYDSSNRLVAFGCENKFKILIREKSPGVFSQCELDELMKINFNL